MATYYYNGILNKICEELGRDTLGTGTRHRIISDFVANSKLSKRIIGTNKQGMPPWGTHAGEEAIRFEQFAKERINNMRSYTKKQKKKSTPPKPEVSSPVLSSYTIIGVIKNHIAELRKLGYEVECKITAPAQEL